MLPFELHIKGQLGDVRNGFCGMVLGKEALYQKQERAVHLAVSVVSGGLFALYSCIFCFVPLMMRGSVMSWTVPVRGKEGYASEIYLVNDADGLSFMLLVTTHSPEEHVWLTRQEQRVCALDVVFDSPWKGRTTKCLLEQGEERGKPCISETLLWIRSLALGGLREGHWRSRYGARTQEEK